MSEIKIQQGHAVEKAHRAEALALARQAGRVLREQARAEQQEQAEAEPREQARAARWAAFGELLEQLRAVAAGKAVVL